jgi:hypothetical protein
VNVVLVALSFAGFSGLEVPVRVGVAEICDEVRFLVSKGNCFGIDWR